MKICQFDNISICKRLICVFCYVTKFQYASAYSFPQDRFSRNVAKYTMIIFVLSFIRLCVNMISVKTNKMLRKGMYFSHGELLKLNQHLALTMQLP